MSLEGLWTAEFYGLHGWENTGVLILRDGHAAGGGRHHYSAGTYSVSEDAMSLSLEINYHGKRRVLFGSSDTPLFLEFDGEHHGDTIEGNVYRVNNSKQTLIFRLTKRAEIP